MVFDTLRAPGGRAAVARALFRQREKPLIIYRVGQRYTRLSMVPGIVCLLLLVVPVLGHAEQFTGKVVGISDGVTLSVLRDGKAVKVRLYGVDAPEQAQAFGTKARQLTGELVFQRDVTVVVHTTDRYGRLVGEVLLPDGRSLSHELVRGGLAWWYRQYASHDTTLAQLEAEARTAKRGLWADAHPVPPWEWRKGKPSTAEETSVPARSVPAPQCCKTCRSGQACGDTCIPHGQTCTRLPGCACQG
jgi:micrococcal nuclease